jgi:outer membrane protein assembly factor BamE (lipoprotein component of BamABCDE complex)
MKSNYTSAVILLLIGPFLFSLACCSGTPRRYLASDASLINPGQTRTDVLQTLGPPDITRENSAGEEELYYYEIHSHFWQRIPFLGRHLGKTDAEALQILLKSDQVVKTKYYVPDLKD